MRGKTIKVIHQCILIWIANHLKIWSDAHPLLYIYIKATNLISLDTEIILSCGFKSTKYICFWAWKVKFPWKAPLSIIKSTSNKKNRLFKSVTSLWPNIKSADVKGYMKFKYITLTHLYRVNLEGVLQYQQIELETRCLWYDTVREI